MSENITYQKDLARRIIEVVAESGWCDPKKRDASTLDLIVLMREIARDIIREEKSDG